MQSRAMAQSPDERSDELLAELALKGDADAFSALVSKYRDIVYAYAYACLRQRDETEDIVQESFVRAFVGLSRLHSARAWGTWLMQIVRNLCRDALRGRRGRRFEPLDDAWPDDSPTPETVVLHDARRCELRRAVADLPEHLRIPLLMRYAGRRSYREIAMALNIPETTVVGRLGTALQRLRRRLDRER